MKDIYDRIVDYLDGKLSAAETLQFEDEVRKDPELKEKLSFMKSMRKAYNKPDHMEFLAKVEEAHQNYIKTHPEIETDYKKPVTPARYMIYAIAAILILGVLVTMVLLSDRPTEQELYRKYYAAFDQQVTYRHNDKAAVKLNRAMELYRAGLFSEAAEVFKQAEESFSGIANFFLGLCYLEMEEYGLAAEHLEAVAKGSELKQEAQWYLALAQLAEGKREETRKTLRVIIDTPGHYYHDKAQSLLEELG